MMYQPTRSTAAVCAVTGGTLWALTPLRQPLLGAGRYPEEAEAVFRLYNAMIVVIAVLLTVALLRMQGNDYRSRSPSFLVGWWAILVGHALLLAGSAVGVILGGWFREISMEGQDVGFVGAMIAALGAIPLGIAGLRQKTLPNLAAAMFVATLPVGMIGSTILEALGVPGDYLGLPLTILYGGAWVALGGFWIRSPNRGAEPAEGEREPLLDAARD